MARKKKQPKLNIKNINTLMNTISSGMKSLYSDSYLSTRDNIDQLGYVADEIEDNINTIIRRNSEYDISNISKVYSKLMRGSSSSGKIEKELSNELEDLFNSPAYTDAIIGSYMANKWIKDLDNEIDIIMRLLPKTKDALNVIKESVLTADSLTKEYISPNVNITDNTELKVVTDRIVRMENKYKLENLIDTCYDNASWYGDGFIYHVPYKKAIARLMNDRQDTGNRAAHSLNVPVIENGVISNDIISLSESAEFDDILNESMSFSVEIDTSRTLASSIQEISDINRVNNSPIGQSSLMESYMYDLRESESLHEDENKTKSIKVDKTIPDELDIPDGLNDRSSYHNGKYSNRLNGDDLKIRGCVNKILKRENLIRLYVDNICMGYYYAEFKDPKGADHFYQLNSDKNLSAYQKAGSTIQKTIADNIQDSKSEKLMRMISKQISDKLDKTFINSNQDLTKEIYAILKYNDIFNSKKGGIKISFLPPEDVKRLYFQEDPDTHIGISDLQDSLIPAKLLAMLYTTYTTGKLTRGQDKRVYYVKQTVETNIAQTLLNVVNQIKKSNFNMRSIENLNNLLNITGRFNDYIIPVGPSGDAPIQFEIMPGQQFDIDSDLYNILEEYVLNPIVPIEFLQNMNSPEFATQYITSSIKLLRKVFRRQSIVEKFSSELYTDTYAMEYDEYVPIKCQLPPPVFLRMINISQLYENTKAHAMSIGELEYEDDHSETADQKRAIFIKEMIKGNLSSYIRQSEIDRYKEIAEFKVAQVTNNNQNNV